MQASPGVSALLAALQAQPPLIEDVALAIAEDEYPALCRARYRALLDDLAAPAVAHLRGASDPRDRLARLTAHVYGTLGFRGNTAAYYDPRNSYLNQVLERRTGIPITLAVVLMALGRRLGLAIEGVGFPGHFLVRFAGLYVDPFNDGRLVDRHELAALARRMSADAAVARRQLEPVDAHAMAVRMLFNLQQIYERRGDHPRALVVCDRLVDLTSGPFHRRDRGKHALVLGDLETARDDLAAYLELQPDAPDAAQVRELLDKTLRPAHKKPN